MRGRRALFCLGLLAAAGCQKAPSHPVQLQTFADIQHKASFAYPAPWTLTRPLLSRLPGPDLGLAYPPSAVIAVSREDEPRLRSTDFEAAEFIYAVRTGLSEHDCAALAGSGTSAVGGMLFRTLAMHAAAGANTREDRVYSALHGPACFLFDLALLRSANAGRAMTAKEQADVQAEMTQILSSVSFQ